MENTSIYDLIIILSTDFFSDDLFTNQAKSDIEAVQSLARSELKSILNGGDNFYMYADFTKSTMNNISKHFYRSLNALNISSSITKKIMLYHEILRDSDMSDAFNTACTEIVLTASRLYWLDIELLNTPVSSELFDIISLIEPLGLDTVNAFYDEDEWLNSKYEWDKYLMSLMDGVDEAPYNIVYRIKTFQEQCDFIQTWLLKLGVR